MRKGKRYAALAISIILTASTFAGGNVSVFAADVPDESSYEVVSEEGISEENDLEADATEAEDTEEPEEAVTETADTEEPAAVTEEEDTKEPEAAVTEKEDTEEPEIAEEEDSSDEVPEAHSVVVRMPEDEVIGPAPGEEGMTAIAPFQLERSSEDDEALARVTASTSQSGTEGNLKWSLSNGILTISGKGEMSSYGSERPGWETYKSDITQVVIKSGVTTIGRTAFAEYWNIEKVTIPNSVTMIDYAAFANCYALTTISGGDKVKTIGSYAFQGVPFTEFKISSSLSSLDGLAFYNCNNLKKFTGGSSTYKVSGGIVYSDKGKTVFKVPAAKSGTYKIPSTVTAIADNAFLPNNGLTSVTIPNTVKKIGSSAFQNCTALQSIVIPDSVTEVGDFTFYGCPALKSVKFGKGLKSTSYRMFQNCTALETIDFGGLEELFAQTFIYCNSLKKITLSSKLKAIGTGNFAECASLESVVFNADVDCVSYQCFLNCRNLKSVSIKKGIKYIYAAAFYGTDKLAAVTLPETIVHSYDHAFSTNTKITNKNKKLTLYGTNGYYLVDKVSIAGTADYQKAYEVLNLVNKERAAQGLGKLYMDQDLLNAAMQRAAETSILFSHTRPDSTSCFTACDKMMAENIAYGQSTASSVMNSWMNSEGHKANILNENEKSIGIGCFIHNGNIFWVQCFGTNRLSANCKKPSNASKTYTVKLYFEKFEDYIAPGSFFFGERETYDYEFEIRLDKTTIAPNETANAKLYVNNPGVSGLKAELKNTNLTWKSSNTNVATVSSSAKITGKAAGTAKIRCVVKSGSGRTASQSITVKQTATGDEQIRSFVTRLYNKCLGRNPDSSGMEHWVSLLKNKQISGAETAYRFVFSAEYKNKKTSDEAFVDMLYTVFMDRKADASGKEHWLNYLQNGMSREYVFRGFAMSQEYTNICTAYGIDRGSVTLTQARDQNPKLTAYVNRMYTKALGRMGEEDGLNHWCELIRTGARTPEEVAEAFILSAEFKRKNLNDEEYIKVLYRAFMGREYDKAGLAHWKGELNRGCTREEILHRFATSKEFKEIQASFGL